ncbi:MULTISPECIES: caspase family protein [unclassified Tolypothrix]|uniref:caspase family protein n=1 Tax=unclassified Tolypothrix TaxID=2649714 RepID=UPI0005EAA692|nr:MULTISPECIES: caspase family protein [unclassified Tolypothrix]BAY89537.1 peptidase C14 caspase catalytic subunit p20 [Microchaete diplosiphon NIES-3275]EKF02509.1 C14 family peptidase [Tolypothrix sp. PCC 7601]MBE9081567.1 caspase family protein [Tolypothrix sp. LEGE 11397]UYD23820.1 caspase family protein [Tolypothrix sp. PCC 7712]UYD33955.1 caspase family protein [Tolypothrix sp. PCC 7601]
MLARTEANGKWALLIGIDKYKYPEVNQLFGCVNDVELMSKILQENFNFPCDRITLLQNEEATRDNILAAMDALVDNVGEDDIVVIHYSGHGSQMTDREGDEKDGLDETIVPHDSGRNPNPNRDITDDEIYLRLLQLSKKTPHTTLIFDCCHSGTISRDPFGVNERWVEPDLRPIAELPPSPVLTELSRGMGDRGPSGWLPLSDRYVLIAACRDEEKAYEYTPLQGDSQLNHGALTYFIGQALCSAQSGTTYRDIFEWVSPQVSAVRSLQHPQMEGARDRLLFDTEEIEPMRFVPVQERTANQITLAAGAAHAMTVGSQWAIYPGATKQVTADTPKLGLVEITTVRAVTCDALILAESYENAILTGTRAVEEAHSYGRMCLKVEIQAPINYETVASELRALISASSLIQENSPEETPDARIYLIPPRTEVTPEDAVPQLGIVTQPIWAVVGKDGQLIIPLQVVKNTNAAQVVRDNLEKVVRYRQTLSLQNPNLDSLLKDKVKFILKRQAADSSWVVAEPENSSGQIVFQDGEQIALEIVNQHHVPVYIGILDFGLTGAVSLLHPIEGSNEQLAPGQSIEIGVRYGDEIYLSIPSDFPFVPVNNKQQLIGETETFKLFVSTRETDFTLRVQDSFERRQVDTNPLRQLLDIAWMGDDGRDVIRSRLRNHRLSEEEWITVERSFFLRALISP